MGQQQRFATTVHTPPLSLTLAKWLQRRKIPGGWRLQELATWLGWHNVRVRYPLGANVTIEVPIALRPFDMIQVRSYERSMLSFIAQRAAQVDRPITLLDCGGDIGLISAHLVAACPNIRRVVAFEPSQTSFPILAGNMKLLPVDAQAINVAVADYTGYGELRGSNRAAFLVPVEHGDIKVMRIDDLGLAEDGCVLLKIDVEGGETAVVHGALETLARASQFIVVFEAHPRVVARTGIDPMDVITLLQSVRPCTVRVTEQPQREVALDIPFFEQFPPTTSYNLCVWTEGE